MKILKVEKIDVSLDNSQEDHELIFYMDDGNSYHVNVKSFDYLSEEVRERMDADRIQEAKWADFEEKEDYRQAYWKRKGFKGFKRKTNPYEENI